MNIGETIKSLRKHKDMTQERLAEYLNISPQAVSRWETGLAYPDITLIPQLANFFGVTSDHILGIDNMKNEVKIQQYLDECQKLNAAGDRKSRFELMKSAINEFPGDFRLLVRYAWTLGEKPFTPPGNSDDIRETSDEIESVCMRILDDCKNDAIRYEAMEILITTYSMLSDFSKARSIIDRLPDYIQTRPEKIESYDDSADQGLQLQHNIQYLAWLLEVKIKKSATAQKDDASKIKLYQKAIHLLELIYDRGDLHFYNNDIADIYFEIAKCHLRQSEHDSALMALEKCIDHCVTFDRLPVKIQHTSLLVDRLSFDAGNTSKGYEGTKSALMLTKLQNALFDKVRNNDIFKNLENLLKQC